MEHRQSFRPFFLVLIVHLAAKRYSAVRVWVEVHRLTRADEADTRIVAIGGRQSWNEMFVGYVTYTVPRKPEVSSAKELQSAR